VYQPPSPNHSLHSKQTLTPDSSDACCVCPNSQPSYIDLEQVLFALGVSQPHQLASVQLSFYPNLLDAAKQGASASGAAQGASQAQQHLLEATAQPVTVEITDARTWEVCWIFVA